MSNEIAEKLASINVRMFALRLDREMVIWIHPDKTTAQWREDVREFLKDQNFTSAEGHAGDDAYNALNRHLTVKGYVEAEDVVCDCYEGRTAVGKAKIVDDPDHEDQKDGFGHFGWEARTFDAS